jgi:RND family efflux transporter MFP subunit
MQALLAQAAGKSLEVNDCVLRAPFDGEIAARLVDPGSFVRPGAALVHLVDRSMVRLSVDVPESDFDAVAPKTVVTLKLLSTGRELTGEVARRAPAADPSTRTVRFEVDIPNKDHAIPVNTTAQIHVDVGEPVAATEIPLLSARVKGKTASVFVVEDSVARARTASVLGERGGSLFVKPDLQAGVHVVTQGRSLLADKDRVAAKIRPADEPRPSSSTILPAAHREGTKASEK